MELMLQIVSLMSPLCVFMVLRVESTYGRACNVYIV